MATKPKIHERKLGREKALGQCFGDGLIEIDPRQTPKEYFLTAIHELLHHCFPDLEEKDIVRYEKIIGDTLWKQGYRRIYK